jgi:site-specific recombinase XerD
MHTDAFELFNTPEPFAHAGWCGTCAACAAARDVPRSRAAAHSDIAVPPVRAGVDVSTSRHAPPHRGGTNHTLVPPCVGRRLAHGLYHGAPLHRLPQVRSTHVLLEAVAVANRSRRATTGSGNDLSHAGLTYHQALALVSSHLQHLVTTHDLAERTVTKVVGNIAALAEFMTSGLCQPFVSSTSASDLARWIDAPLGGHRRQGEEAAATTRRLRRSSARLFFRVLRALGMFEGDPTLDIAVHPGVSGTTIPLADAELLQLRYACISLDADTRLPTCLALAESTATTGEMARVEIHDVDLVRALVWLRGDSRRQARQVPLSPWAVKVLRRRIEHLRPSGAGASTRIAYAGSQDATSSESPGASTAGAMGELLKLAGLAGEPGIKPGSIGLGFALRVWNQHGDIRLVARALGYRDYNKAAKAIGVDPEAGLEPDAVTDALRACVLQDAFVKNQVGKRRRGGDRRAQRSATPATSRMGVPRLPLTRSSRGGRAA